MESHSHTKTMPDGSTVDIFKLHELVLAAGLIAETRPTTKMASKCSRSRRSGFSKERYDAAQMSWPLMVRESDDLLMDGRHRLAKAIDRKLSYVYVVVVPDEMVEQAKS